jgi:transcriptional regulator with XRE-family HTH domain
MWFEIVAGVDLQKTQRRLDARQIAQTSRRLRELRATSGLTQRKLASRAGISSGMVSALETGAAQPSLGTMLALQAALGLSSIEELLGPLPDGPSVGLLPPLYDADAG